MMSLADGGEYTLGDIYDEISEHLAIARTQACLGNREEALAEFNTAKIEFIRFQESLRGYPGYAALEYAFNATLQALTQNAAG